MVAVSGSPSSRWNCSDSACCRAAVSAGRQLLLQQLTVRGTHVRVTFPARRLADVVAGAWAACLECVGSTPLRTAAWQRPGHLARCPAVNPSARRRLPSAHFLINAAVDAAACQQIPFLVLFAPLLFPLVCAAHSGEHFEPREWIVSSDADDCSLRAGAPAYSELGAEQDYSLSVSPSLLSAFEAAPFTRCQPLSINVCCSPRDAFS